MKRPSLQEWIKGPHRGYLVRTHPWGGSVTLSVQYLVRDQVVGMDECLSFHELDVIGWRARVADALRKCRWHARLHARWLL